MGIYDVKLDDKELVAIKEEGSETLAQYEADVDEALDANKSAWDTAKSTLQKGQNELESAANAQTEFAIDEIERQKAQAQKDYTKEQSAAYTDYQKQIDPYGANAEKMASAGLDDSGYAESSKVAMHNQYQTRITVARESLQRSIDNFNAGIAEARMQNNATLAQIRYETLMKQLEYDLTFAMKETELLTQMAGQKVAIKQNTDSKWLQMYGMLQDDAQHDEALAEQKRQYDGTMALEKAKFEYQKQQDAIQAAQRSAKASGNWSSSSKKSSSKKSSGSKKLSTAKDIKSANKETATKKSRKAAEPTVDMKSVLALGYGPISASKLNSLVASGKVKEYEEGGKLKYKKVFNGKRQYTNGLTVKNK